MEKRLLIALALAAVVILISQKLFPASPPPIKATGDTTAVMGHVDTTGSARVAQDSSAPVPPVPTVRHSDVGQNAVTANNAAMANAVDTIAVVTPKATYHFTST